MKMLILGMVLTMAFCLSVPTIIDAKGSRGGHGGGHAGGHAAGGPGGHSSGQARGTSTSTSHGAPVTRAGGTAPTTVAPAPPTTRVRHGEPVVGTAVPRPATSSPLGTRPLLVPPYRFRPSVGTLGFGGFGLYSYYDPFRSSLMMYGYPGYLYGYTPAWPFPPALAPYGYAPYPIDAEGITGGLRLKIEPKEAQVYVDGYYAGIVDDFNGHFQRLKLIPGPHHVEVRALGYEPLTFEIRIEAFHTTEYRGTLQRAPQ